MKQINAKGAEMFIYDVDSLSVQKMIVQLQSMPYNEPVTVEMLLKLLQSSPKQLKQ